MKSKKILKFALLITLLVSLLSGVCFATEVDATEEKKEPATDEEVVVYDDGSGETEAAKVKWTEDDIYLFKPDENIIIDDNVSGNLFLIGKDITINSDVIYGSLYVLSTQSLKITEGCQITGSVYACSPKMYLEVITSDIYAVAGDFTLVENYGVYRDFKLLTDTAEINGAITRNAYIMAQNSLKFGENALVFGNIEYSAPSEITFPKLLSENCAGEIKYKALNNANEIPTDNIEMLVFDFASNVVVIVAIFVVCALLNLKVVHQYENKNVLKQALKHLFIGIITFLNIVVIMTLLLISVVGITLSGMIALIFVLTFMLYLPIFVISVSNALSQKLNKIFSLIISTIVLWALVNIPVAGPICSIIMYFISLGIIMCSLIDGAKNKPEDSKIKEKENTKQEIIEESKTEEATTENEKNDEVKEEIVEDKKEEDSQKIEETEKTEEIKEESEKENKE